MMRIFSFTLLAFVAGCAYPDQFRNVSKERPHAILKAENPFGFRGFFSLGRDVSPFFINRQRTAFWRMGDTFKIPPGTNTVDVIDASEPYEYEPMQFTAVEGWRYTIRPTRIGDRDAVTLSEHSANEDGEHIIASALRRPK